MARIAQDPEENGLFGGRLGCFRDAEVAGSNPVAPTRYKLFIEKGLRQLRRDSFRSFLALVMAHDPGEREFLRHAATPIVMDI